MALTINTNVASLNAQRNLSTSSTDLATSLQRLSSGLRINSAKDDAAGLAISERMSTQIRGMNVAMRNANDGISLAQTAEGSLDSVNSALQRIRELAVQSANASNSVSDRAALDVEAQQLKSEIDRVATQTNFNGITLLDGSFANQSFQVGANEGETISVNSIINTKINNLGSTSATNLATTTGVAIAGAQTAATVTGQVIAAGTANPTSVEGAAITTLGTATVIAGATVSTGALDAGDLTINGRAIGAVAAGADAAGQVTNLIAAINAETGDTNVVATATGTNAITLTNNATGGTDSINVALTGTDTAAEVGLSQAVTTNAANLGVGAITIGGTDVGAVTAGINAADAATNLATAINLIAGTTGVSATVGGTSNDIVTLSRATSDDIVVAFGTGGSTATTGLTAATTTSDPYTAIAANDITITNALGNAINVGAITAGADATAQANAVRDGINAITAQTGVTATVANGQLTLARGAGETADIVLTMSGGATATNTGLTAGTFSQATTFAAITANDITIADADGTAHNVGAVASGGDAATQAGNLRDAINAIVGDTGVTATIDTATPTQVTLTAAHDIVTTVANTATLANTGMAASTTAAVETAAAVNGFSSLNLNTVEAANKAIESMDAALTQVNTARADLGAIQTRFESVVSNLAINSENASAARGRIVDADFAAETAMLTRNQILQQAGVAMLAQANSIPQNVLSLLR